MTPDWCPGTVMRDLAPSCGTLHPIMRDVASYDSWRVANAADLAAVNDPLRHTTTRTHDEVSRLVILSDSLDRSLWHTSDFLNPVSTLVGPFRRHPLGPDGLLTHGRPGHTPARNRETRHLTVCRM
ncbi:MAG: hypothetical protein H6Q86_3802 [candidate division NC10 bacterium]|nr:hypothetical protein [candidate division NC10 bacterium]